MRNSKNNLDPSARLVVVLALLLALAWSAVVVIHPFFIGHLELKLTDAIVATAPNVPISDQVVVVEIDEQSLATWGQWPWPRTRLACLLEKLKALGAKSIALDFIMAEPDRTGRPTASPGGANGTSACASEVMVRETPDGPTDNDAVLAATLATGPFVLGYGFDFGGHAPPSSACHLPALEIINIRHPALEVGGIHFYEAKGIICNIPQLAVNAPYAGFLNGQPDGDGLLRRLPLIITYNGTCYPNLALAALLATQPHEPLTIWQRQGEQNRLVFGPHTIPIDENGNLLIHFTKNQPRLHHFPATQVLADQLSARAVRGRIVLVGLSAIGLTPVYQTPQDSHVTAVDVHAQAVETILSGSTIRRYAGIVYAEILLALLVAGLYGLCIARLEFLPTILTGAAGLLVLGIGTHVLFISRRILVLPLLPAAVIISGGLFLMLFKYWTRQRKASQQLRNALVLIKNNERHLNAIIQTIPDIVFRLDESGRITFISPAITKYQKAPETLIGRHILDLVNPEDKAAAAFRINERRTGPRATRDMELRLLLSLDGDAKACGGRYFSISAEGIYTPSQADKPLFAGTQGIAKDIDERKHLERRLERSKKMEPSAAWPPAWPTT
ncbi:CHASE2 domain-containing protein [Desulfosarcina cetonica]|uniref:CHASE2 domain-containing protein n=1 Tax=Desulfosarcina cetonica TaxID=90730 RepID=UPI0006CFFF70|nr:CHASE2 domain-containing protein [Desulfosarcina cetonica]